MGHVVNVSQLANPVYLNADPTRLAQVVGNLLTNAAEFIDAVGQIWPSVEEDGSDVLIRVRDDGIGITADKLPCIFEMLMQVDTSLERSVSGLGIGMSLIKNLVELHGGSISATSAGADQGSDFVVRPVRCGYWSPV